MAELYQALFKLIAAVLFTAMKEQIISFNPYLIYDHLSSSGFFGNLS